VGYWCMYKVSSGTKALEKMKKTYFVGMGFVNSVRGRGNYDCPSGHV
jgi:hypothetical protein